MIILFKWLFLNAKLIWYQVGLYFFPTHKETYCANLGVTYFALEKFVKAIIIFRKSEELNGGRNNNLSKYNAYYLGYSYLNLGNHRQAVKFFEKYLHFDPKDSEIMEFVGWCNVLLYRHEAALNNYLRLAELKPNNPAYLIESAKILLELDKKDEAYNQLEIAKKLNGVALDLFIDSLKHRCNNDLKNAILILEQAIEKITTDKNNLLYSQLGDVYILLSEYKKEIGDLEGTVSVLEGLCKVTPDDFWAINCLAFEYADQGEELEKALALINRCLKYQPENSFFMDTKGWVLFKIGRVKEAKKLIEKSLELNPNAKETQAHHMLIKDHMGLKTNI